MEQVTPDFMARGFDEFEMAQVTCPDCGCIGGNRYPCWCSNCRKKHGTQVMMLPSCNGNWLKNWSEHVKTHRKKG